MNFRRLLKGAGQGEVIAPILRAALWNPNFKSFSVKMPGFEERPPDGWFHPSTHPLWPERLLYYYLSDATRLTVEPFDPHTIMAFAQGHFWHEFIQHVGIDNNVLRRPPGPCPCGCKSKKEWYVEDKETGSRGHMDGIVDPDTAAVDEPEVFEFKTMRPGRASRLPKLPPGDPELVEFFRKMVPDYYAQGQEYLRLSGYRRWRGLILSMEYPFDMREIVMGVDHAHNFEIEQKYRRVRQAVADQTIPQPCCGPRTKEAKECPARLICPVGLA